MAEALSGMTGALQGSIGGLLNKGQGILDRFFPPERRNELAAKLSKFATEKPMFAVRPLCHGRRSISVAPVNHLEAFC